MMRRQSMCRRIRRHAHALITVMVGALAMTTSACVLADDKAAGFSHQFDYTGEVFANVHGGMRQGTVFTDLAHLSLDWAGAQWLAHTDVYAPYGDSLTGRNTGDFSVVSNIDSVHQIRVHELWVQRSNDGWSLRAGLLSADTEFWGDDTANLFISSAFGAPSVVSGNLPNPPIFPQGVLGIRADWDIGDGGAVRIAALDGDGGDLTGENRHGLQVSLGQGTLLLMEYQPVFISNDAHGTAVRLGAYYHSGRFIDTSGESVRGNFGFIGSIDHPIDGRLSAFARVSAARGDRSTVPWSVETGLNVDSVFGSSGKLGVALAYVDLNRNSVVTGTATSLRHEIILEGTLDLPLNKWWDVQPDVQYIVDPGGAASARNALVFGLRVNGHY
jgi:porin